MTQVEPRRAPARTGELRVTSAAFGDGAPIPERYSRGGENVSPPLSWIEPPAGTRSIAIVCVDPDAPSGNFTHWIAWGIHPACRGVGEGLSPAADFRGVRQGRNDFGDTGYGGPQPPPGERHRYRFRVVALDQPLQLAAGASSEDFERAIEGHVLAEALLVGTYQRR
jgi:Raf kinase inhibitor-like YbhB/YbcL family protein